MPTGDDDPFAELGLAAPYSELTAEQVHSAFRRAALATHPDKAGPASSDAFARLKDARDRAIAVLAGERDFFGGGGSGEGDGGREGGVGGTMVNAGVTWAMRWAAQIAFEAVRCREARPIELDLDVSLEDAYYARVKKVVISVLRVGGERPFERTRQTLYVRLLSRGGPDGTLDVVFPRAGDDPPAAILLGLKAWSQLDGMDDFDVPPPRSDVTIRVHVRSDHRPSAFRRDIVVRGCDLHADAAISLEGHYLGETVELPHPSGTPVVVRYLPSSSSAAATSEDDSDPRSQLRQVRVLHGMGLPYLDVGEEDPDRKKNKKHMTSASANSCNFKRGDAYVFLETRLPILDLGRRDVLDALSLLKDADQSEKGVPESSAPE